MARTASGLEHGYLTLFRRMLQMLITVHFARPKYLEFVFEPTVDARAAGRFDLVFYFDQLETLVFIHGLDDSPVRTARDQGGQEHRSVWL